MHIMYVDESGDSGTHQYSSQHFILSGLIVNQSDWDKYLGRLKSFRKFLKDSYGLKLRTEIHAKELIRIDKNQDYKSIRKSDRIRILKEASTHLPRIFDNSAVINICIDKSTISEGTDIFNLAWGRLLQRYDTFLKKTATDKGIVIVDGDTTIKIMRLHRKMRIYNPVPSIYTPPYHNVPIDSVIEDVFSRQSHHSYFIQAVDVIAYLLYRKEFKKGSLRKYGIEFLFDNIDPILLKVASGSDPQGIVRA